MLPFVREIVDGDPPSFADLAIPRLELTADDPGGERGADVGGDVAVVVGDLVVGTAEHADDRGGYDVQASLLPRFADRRVRRLLVGLDRAAWRPPATPIEVPQEQQGACVVADQHAHRWQKEPTGADVPSERGDVAATRHRPDPLVDDDRAYRCERSSAIFPYSSYDVVSPVEGSLPW
jgi:hypothetical protein